MFRISHPLALLLLGLCVLFNVSRNASADDDIVQGFKSLGNEILVSDSVDGLKKKIFRYGNWYGPGYWGGSEDPNTPGSKGPVDSLDEVAMRHDFAYLLAEQQGAIYGKEEELRLKGIADKIAVDEAKALPADPRKWPNPPRGSVDYEDIKSYRERMIGGFKMEKEGYRIASTLTKLDRINNDKLGAILDVTDQKQKFNEADIKRRVKTLTKNWKNVTDFEKATEDAKLTKEQSKELFQKFKENPKAFQKYYTDYKKNNFVPKSKAGIAQDKARVIQDKETAAIAKKYNVYPDNLLQFYNCACKASGGSLGGYYKPGKGGPCVATGPLSSWNTAMPSSKKAILPCLNQLDRDRYEKDQKIFDEMRQKDKEIERQRQINSEKEYPKYLQLIQEENAKSAQAEVAQIREAIASERFMEAADIWDGIKSLISDNYMITEYIDGKAQGLNLPYYLSETIKGGLLSQARAHAIDLEMQNPLGMALKKIARACSINQSSSNGYCEEMQAKYTTWEKNWNDVISKDVPAATNLVQQGKIISATAILQAISPRFMSQQLPPRSNDPILVGLWEQIKSKQKEYDAALEETTKVLAKLNKDPDPRGIVRTIEAFKKAWEPRQVTLDSLNYQLGVAAQNVRFAERADKDGDDYQEKGRFPSAIDRYQVSLKLQKDASVQRKLDSLLSRLAREKAAAQTEKKQASGQARSAGCKSDNDCPPGYVCDRRTGKCGSPFDDNYSSFGKISTTRDDQRSTLQTNRVAANQTSTRKRGFSSSDFEEDLDSIQDNVASVPTQASPDSSGLDSETLGTVRSSGELVSDATTVLTGTTKTTPNPTPASTSANKPRVTSPTPKVTGSTTGAGTKPATSSGSAINPPVSSPQVKAPINTPVTQTPPVSQSRPPAITQSTSSTADSGFDPKGFLGTWNYSGTRPDGKKRSGTMSFYFGGGPPWGGTMSYSIVDADGQSNGKGTGTWTVVEGPSDSATLTLSIGGKTWTGPISGEEDVWVFNSSHGTYSFRK